MATRTEASIAKREGTRPVLIVAATVVTVVALSFLIYTVGNPGGQNGGDGLGSNRAGSTGGGACGQATPADSSYAVDFTATPDPPRPEGTTLALSPRQAGRAVTGAKVCLLSDMPEMQHPPINVATKESSPGRYEGRVQFGMGGEWKTWVTIVEADKPPVSVLLKIQVAPVSPS